MGEPIPPSDTRRLEDTAAHLVRNLLSLKKLVYLDGSQAVLYRSRIPDPGQHHTLFCGEYSRSGLSPAGAAHPAGDG